MFTKFTKHINRRKWQKRIVGLLLDVIFQGNNTGFFYLILGRGPGLFLGEKNHAKRWILDGKKLCEMPDCGENKESLK